MKLRVVSPQRVVLEREVNRVTVPAVGEQLTILRRHIPLVTILEPGEVQYSAESQTDYLSIREGFLEVNKDEVVILTQEATMTDEVNEQEIIKARDRAQRILMEKPVGVNLSTVQASLKKTYYDLKLLRRKKKKTPVTD